MTTAVNTPVNVRRPGRRGPSARPVVVNNNVAAPVNVRRPRRQPRRNVVVNRPYNRNRYVYNRRGCAPAYTPVYNPVIYTNYNARRCYRPRRYYRACPIPLLSLGFFLTRPYSYYSYATPGYYSNQPFFYGDEEYYQPGPFAQGGPSNSVAQDQPVADVNTSDAAVASTVSPANQSSEQQMLAVLSEFVEGRSKDGRYRVKDAAFENQTWQLELAQAPAVYEIADGKYAVVAGFEGTLGVSSVPSQVTMEFFMVKAGNGYAVRDAWISAANGIARNKLFQSPDYPDVKTWQPGVKCPFTGKTMVPVPPEAENKVEQHG